MTELTQYAAHHETLDALLDFMGCFYYTLRAHTGENIFTWYFPTEFNHIPHIERYISHLIGVLISAGLIYKPCDDISYGEFTIVYGNSPETYPQKLLLHRADDRANSEQHMLYTALLSLYTKLEPCVPTETYHKILDKINAMQSNHRSSSTAMASTLTIINDLYDIRSMMRDDIYLALLNMLSELSKL